MLSRRQLRIKAIKALYAHLKSDSDNMIASEKNMMNSIDKTYDLYFQMMTLPVELAHYAQQRQELAKQKKLPTYEDLHPNTRFIDNAVIRMIADSDTVNDRMASPTNSAGANIPNSSAHFTTNSRRRTISRLT